MSSVLEATTELKKITETELLNEPVPHEDKLRRVYELRMKGTTISNLAKLFQVAESTIYRWLALYEKNFNELFLNRPRSDLLFDRIRYITVIRDAAMQTAHQIELTEKYTRPDGTVAIRDNVDYKSKGIMLKLALEAENSVFKMLKDTGVLPSAVKEIHHSMEETKPAERVTNNIATLPREELIANIVTLVSSGRTLPEFSQEDLIEAPVGEGEEIDGV